MTTDRDGNRSNPYRPDPAQCCEACVFGSGEHAEFCSGWVIKRPVDIRTGRAVRIELRPSHLEYRS